MGLSNPEQIPAWRDWMPAASDIRYGVAPRCGELASILVVGFATLHRHEAVKTSIRQHAHPHRHRRCLPHIQWSWATLYWKVQTRGFPLMLKSAKAPAPWKNRRRWRIAVGGEARRRRSSHRQQPQQDRQLPPQGDQGLQGPGARPHHPPVQGCAEIQGAAPAHGRCGFRSLRTSGDDPVNLVVRCLLRGRPGAAVRLRPNRIHNDLHHRLPLRARDGYVDLLDGRHRQGMEARRNTFDEAWSRSPRSACSRDSSNPISAMSTARRRGVVPGKIVCDHPLTNPETTKHGTPLRLWAKKHRAAPSAPRPNCCSGDGGRSD